MSPKMIFCCPFFRISNQAVYLHEIWHVGTSTNIRKKQKMAVYFLQTPSTLNMHDVPSPHRTQNTYRQEELASTFPTCSIHIYMASVGGWSSHSSYPMATATPPHTYHPPSSPPYSSASNAPPTIPPHSLLPQTHAHAKKASTRHR